ncbi:MAG: Zn-ribbon domain-containing OB-fold protein [Spirochaetota bacterium]|nr:Zn-ribbon domain-containing OB-fold protein [Spirochaetota bacterium]
MVDKPFNDYTYNQYLNEDKLMGSICKKCGAKYLPPRPLCIECFSSDMEWFESSGKGQLTAFTSIFVGPPFMIKEGFDRKNPYCVGVVTLSEGVKINGRILGVDVKNPETIKVGTPMTLEFLHMGEGENMKTHVAFNVA